MKRFLSILIASIAISATPSWAQFTVEDKTKTKQEDVKFEKDETPIKDLDDFDVNMVLFGKLMPQQVEGGTLLKDTSFRMRK